MSCESLQLDGGGGGVLSPIRCQFTSLRGVKAAECLQQSPTSGPAASAGAPGAARSGIRETCEILHRLGPCLLTCSICVFVCLQMKQVVSV